MYDVGALSDQEVLRNTGLCAEKEITLTVKLLLHLVEVEKRELHLQQGYSSLFMYLTKGLKYSEPGACRRLAGVKAIREYPFIKALLLSRDISLTTLSLVQKLLTIETAREVIEAIRGKSKPEVEAYVALKQPKKIVMEKITPVATPPAEGRGFSLPLSVSVEQKLSGPIREMSSSLALTPAEVGAPPVERPTPAEVQKLMRVMFVVSEGCYKKLCHYQSLTSSLGLSLAEGFERLLDYYIKRECPVERAARRGKRALKGGKDKRARGSSRTRHVPASLADEVRVREGNRCAYVGPDGIRCDSTYMVQLQHIKPFAKGGEHSLENLTCYCAAHNQLEARIEFGEKATAWRKRQ